MLTDTTSKRRRYILLRHGEVAYFTPKGEPVKAETVPLTAEGEQQAKAAHDVIKALNIDRAISSGLPRTEQTARIVLGNRLSNGLALETIQELQEIKGGRLHELPATDLKRAFTEAFAGGLTPESKFLGGETFGSLWDRVSVAWERIRTHKDAGTTLIVAHGAVNRVILSQSLRASISSFGSIEQDACCINVIDVDDSGRSIVRLLNYTPYNSLKEGLVDTTMERLWKSWRRA